MKRFVITCLSIMGVGLVLLTGCKSTTSTPGISTTSTVSTLTTSVASIPPNPIPVIKAPVPIDNNSDGQTVSVNLVKFIGNLPSSYATVRVNNNTVTADSNGSYCVYLDLKKGANVIEVKTTADNETKTEDIHIFLVPPLTIRLNIPNFDPNTDLKIPTPISGVVSNPKAEVEVNGLKMKMNPNGVFTTQILSVVGSNHANVTARLGNEVDEERLNWYLGDNGQLAVVSGFKTVPDILPTVTLNHGESTSFDFSIEFDKTIPDASLNTVSITRITDLADTNNSLPMLSELQIIVEPSTYTTYNRVVYESKVVITTLPGIEPGNYFFNISSSIGKGVSYTSGTNYSVIDINQLNDTPKGADFEVVIK